MFCAPTFKNKQKKSKLLNLVIERLKKKLKYFLFFFRSGVTKFFLYKEIICSQKNYERKIL